MAAMRCTSRMKSRAIVSMGLGIVAENMKLRRSAGADALPVGIGDDEELRVEQGGLVVVAHGLAVKGDPPAAGRVDLLVKHLLLRPVQGRALHPDHVACLEPFALLPVEGDEPFGFDAATFACSGPRYRGSRPSVRSLGFSSNLGSTTCRS